MKILIFVCALFGVESTTYNLTETPNGLVGRWRSPANRFRSFVVDTQISEPFDRPMLLFSDERFHSFPLGPESAYASRTNSTMILPPSESHPYFRMIENPTDPRINCFEGTMGVADMIPGPSLGFYAGIELIPSSNDTNSSRPVFEGAPMPFPYQLSTIGTFDEIPTRIFNILLCAISRLDVQTAEDENINLLPTIEYTVYRSRDSEVPVARIISKPRDYLKFTADLIRWMVHPSDDRLRLGTNTLKHMGVLIDYQNHQIGFCEPL